MTEQELTEFLENNKEAIMAASRDAMLAKITESVKWHIPDVLHQTVSAFMEKEIAPEVAKALADQKGAIIEAAKISAASISNRLAEKMMEQCVKSLDGYRAQDVFKVLLGVR